MNIIKTLIEHKHSRCTVSCFFFHWENDYNKEKTNNEIRLCIIYWFLLPKTSKDFKACSTSMYANLLKKQIKTNKKPKKEPQVN